MDRRKFSLGMALAPFGLAYRDLHAQQAAQHTPEPPDNSAYPPPPPKRRFEIYEENHFQDPFVFKRSDVKTKVLPFPLRDVQLSGNSPYTDSRAWSRGFMLRIDTDRLLHNFRVNAGIPSNATPLGGKEAPSAPGRGHWVGHYLSACGLLYASTRDREIKTVGDTLVAGIAECQTKLGPSGFIAAFPESSFMRLDYGQKTSSPFYTFHKLMAGMLDMHEHGENQQALDVALKMAAWVDSWTAARSEERMQDILSQEFGGMGEVLYNLSFITNDDRWGQVGDRFQKKVFLLPLLERRDELRQLHVNTHVPQVIAAARRYELTGDARFRVMPEFFWETVTESRTFVTGGSGTMERWVTYPNHLAWEMKSSSEHQECCCAYNMMKLTRHMYGWDPQMRYVEYYERNLLNHRLGAIEPKTGHTTYFISMSPGAWKTTCTEDQTFWCCNGTALEEYSKLQNSIYFHDEKSLYVNLFVPSELSWRDRGITLTQETTFPNESKTLLTITSTPREKWSLRIRVPSWTTDDVRVLLNGHPLDFSPQPGSYLNLARTWRAGDQVELEMPMRIRREVLEDDPSLQAFIYGPIVLAGQFPMTPLSTRLLHGEEDPKVKESPITVPTLSSRGDDLDKWITPVNGENMTFRTVGSNDEEVVLKPLNQSWQRFAVYFKVV